MKKSYPYLRNDILRKYVQLPHHLNWIRLDGNSKIKHQRKVCEICLELRQKGYDFLTRPLISYWNKDKDYWDTLIPDIVYWIPKPFRTVIVEVIDSESKEHAESKSYPNEFKVVTLDVDDRVEGLV